MVRNDSIMDISNNIIRPWYRDRMELATGFLKELMEDIPWYIIPIGRCFGENHVGERKAISTINNQRNVLLLRQGIKLFNFTVCKNIAGRIGGSGDTECRCAAANLLFLCCSICLLARII
jgi:hypothetical protein